MSTHVMRLATIADAPSILAIYAPFVRDTAVSFETDIPDIAEMERRIASTLVTHPWLVLEQEGVVIAYAYASSHRVRAAYRWAADVSVYVAPTAQRHGAARRLYTALFALLRELSYATALAGVTLPNVASVALHESMGFTPVGVYKNIGFKMDRWHDVGWWQLALGAYNANPGGPTPLAALANESNRLVEILRAY